MALDYLRVMDLSKKPGMQYVLNMKVEIVHASNKDSITHLLKITYDILHNIELISLMHLKVLLKWYPTLHRIYLKFGLRK